MTTKEKLVNMLVNMGMFESQAKTVIELAIPVLNESTDGYKITWNRPSEEYPKEMYAIWLFQIKPVALKWIDENCPKAWYRSMFIS